MTAPQPPDSDAEEPPSDVETDPVKDKAKREKGIEIINKIFEGELTKDNIGIIMRKVNAHRGSITLSKRQIQKMTKFTREYPLSNIKNQNARLTALNKLMEALSSSQPEAAATTTEPAAATGHGYSKKQMQNARNVAITKLQKQLLKHLLKK